jgi:hypothetical protein
MLDFIRASTTDLPEVDGQAPEAEVAHDLVRRLVPIAPLFIVAGAIGWGWAGAASATFALVLVAANFMVAAGLITWGARSTPGVLMGVVLGGYVARLAVLFGIIWLVRDAAWVEMVPLGLTLVAAHLGLLLWETRYVSISLAHPGVKPAPPEASP